MVLDPNIMKKSGRVCFTADLGYEYGFKDINGILIIIFKINILYITCMPRIYSGICKTDKMFSYQKYE